MPIWAKRRWCKAVLTVTQLSAGYNGLSVVEQATITVETGSLTVLVGANGAGKTTLLKAIAGVIPSSGSVVLDGVDISGNSVSDRVAKGLVLVPEGRHLFPDMTVADNLELGGYCSSASERRSGVDRVLHFFPRLAERRRQLAGTMSGGEQQMLAIGRALVSRPKLIMLDEPSLGLAPKIVAELFRIICDIGQAGTSVLLVEQNVRQAMRISNYSYVIERGAIVAQGHGKELLDTDIIRQAYLGTI
jgi:branched-chain amino acid transport system ATP-binding protein